MPKIQLEDGTEIILSVQRSESAFESQGPVADKIKAKLSDISAQCGQVLLETVSALRERLTSMAPSELEIEIVNATRWGEG